MAATGATVAFTANSIGECLLYTLNAEVAMYDSTVMGDDWRTYHVDATLVGSWSGSGECYLDYDDTKQKAMIDDIMAASPASATKAMVYGVYDEKLFYGLIMMTNLTITADNGSLVTVTFNFTGTGHIRPRWD